MSNYVIPKVQLQRCFLSISLKNLKIIGYPIRIDNKVYVRNAFYFNLCFVFDCATRTFGHEPIIRKAAEYLVRETIFGYSHFIDVLSIVVAGAFLKISVTT